MGGREGRREQVLNILSLRTIYIVSHLEAGGGEGGGGERAS